MTQSATDKLIADNLWRGMEEYPKEMQPVACRIESGTVGIAYCYHLDYEWPQWNFMAMGMNCVGALDNKSKWLPLPDDRCANALKIAVEALRALDVLATNTMDSPTQKALTRCPADMSDIAHEALAAIERIADNNLTKGD